MSISNFTVTKIERGGTLNLVTRVFAEADITTSTGHLFWKKEKTARRMMCRDVLWFFTDDGSYVGDEIHQVIRLYEVKNGQIPFL